MKFSEIAAFADLKTKLIHSINSGHIAHAQMFASKEGGMGLNMALAYATYLNCENKQEGDACGTCPSCYKMNKLIHPDLHFIFPIIGTKIKGKSPTSENFIVQWREFLNEKPYGTWQDWGKKIDAENKQLLIPKDESRRILNIASLKAFEAEYKVLLIWLPELLNMYSANALLKVIEEPPEKTIFLFVSENTEKIISTIISRTQVIRIPPLSFEDSAQILIDEFGVEKDKANTIARIADGNISEAVALSSEIEDSRHLAVRNWLLDCFKADFTSITKRADEFHKMGREAQKAFFSFTLSLLRESVLLNAKADEIVMVPKEQEEFIRKFAKANNWEKISIICDEINEAYYHLERNLYSKIVFLDLSLTISSVFQKKN